MPLAAGQAPPRANRVPSSANLDSPSKGDRADALVRLVLFSLEAQRRDLQARRGKRGHLWWGANGVVSTLVPARGWASASVSALNCEWTQAKAASHAGHHSPLRCVASLRSARKGGPHLEVCKERDTQVAPRAPPMGCRGRGVRHLWRRGYEVTPLRHHAARRMTTWSMTTWPRGSGIRRAARATRTRWKGGV